MEKMERKTIRVAIYCRMGREDPDHTMLEAGMANMLKSGDMIL